MITHLLSISVGLPILTFSFNGILSCVTCDWLVGFCLIFLRFVYTVACVFDFFSWPNSRTTPHFVYGSIPWWMPGQFPPLGCCERSDCERVCTHEWLLSSLWVDSKQWNCQYMVIPGNLLGSPKLLSTLTTSLHIPPSDAQRSKWFPHACQHLLSSFGSSHVSPGLPRYMVGVSCQSSSPVPFISSSEPNHRACRVLVVGRASKQPKPTPFEGKASSL